MRDIPAALAARLEEGATTLCHCWSLTRRDGLALGFTDHDRDLVIDGLTYAARTGLEAAEASAELGFAVGGGDVAGALSSAGIAPDDITAGLYDGASVETWLVDWSMPEARLLLDVATIGEIRRAGTAFVAELRGLMQQLDIEQGRLYRATCDAELGEPRCGIDLDDPRWRTGGTVIAMAGPSRLTVTLDGSFAEGWFAGGRLRWTSGANTGLDAGVRAQGRYGALDLWQPPAREVAPGDAFMLTAGCDKRFSTCREKFANSLNFQGFPHMPGNDFVIRPAPGSNTALDGGSLFR
ncbi:DUF2163 domain-containing protein [Methylobacterium brachythecii]|uniref:Putative phage protein (TIGR02218 family) n=1 Tax=Methylobacterium brachythecii TaxID=1176177 RepID=A0A7W6F4U6_9HYPH|nr:DUF2163 domain-containing protein [Methylobacterium brachythecii]MBB3900755.1 putative phage protein (TIGR02218 family) [Methylobacterium brachythecii]GLS46614.1 hypothetical protein GCM10007884_46080 [Methylobacterium brachythecii]